MDRIHFSYDARVWAWSILQLFSSSSWSKATLAFTRITIMHMGYVRVEEKWENITVEIVYTILSFDMRQQLTTFK